MSIETGLGSLLEPLAKDLNIQYRRVVQSIEYDEKHDQVIVGFEKNPACADADESDASASPSILNTNQKEVDASATSYKCNAVVCTIPLGCLKESKVDKLQIDEDENLRVPTVQFQPSLPAAKLEVIEGARVGSINKVILVFEQRFWSDNHFFGRINDRECARGELFLFVSSPDSNVLSVYLTGAAANLGDSFSNDDFSHKLMMILGKIFGTDCPAAPKEVIVTSWHSNNLAHGAFPYIPVGRTDVDYDVLAKPVKVENEDLAKHPYLFFAGDHTCREYPGRLHGAFLSGLREAARVANIFLGAINEPGKSAEYEEIGQSFTKNMINKVEEVYLSD